MVSTTSTRKTRSQTKTSSDPSSHTTLQTLQPPPPSSSTSQQLSVLPSQLNIKITSLNSEDLRILRKKKTWLQKFQPSIPGSFSTSTSSLHDAISHAVSSTLVFAQYEAGTAMCVSSSGLLLTCSHCVGESEAEVTESNRKGQFLLFADGRVVKTRCVAWDAKRDLAVLRIMAAQPESGTESTISGNFPFTTLSSTAPAKNERLLCIGHPGSEDLEVSDRGVPTNYDVLHVSEGKFRGYAKGQDIQDNSEIGALMHDCWTYWGHSGAPLINASGTLVGLHSSWDDETAMRRGIGWECLKWFFDEVISGLDTS